MRAHGRAGVLTQNASEGGDFADFLFFLPLLNKIRILCYNVKYIRLYQSIMSNFSKSRFQRPSFNKKPFGDNRGFDRGAKQMHSAECATCGDVCEVPFRPTGTRPIYCNNCFGKGDAPRPTRSDAPSRGPSREFTPRPDQAFNDLKAELRGVNEKLERLITLMTPTQKVIKPSKKKEK